MSVPATVPSISSNMKSKQRYTEVPETWEELTEADWREVLKIRQLVAATDHQWTAEDVRIETARAILQNRGIKTQPNNELYLMLLSKMQKSLTWLWQEHDGGLSLCYRSTVNLLPRVKHGEHIWIGPLSHGEDLLFGEFRQAMIHLNAWETTQTETPLAALAGLLYRPEATDEQKHEQQLRRQPYDWDAIGDNIKRGLKMQPWQRWGIYAWFSYFCEYLATGTFIIEGGEVCFEPLFDTTSGSKIGKNGGGTLAQIALTLAESHVFGTIKDVDHTPLLTVMLKLLMDYEVLRKLKAKK